MVLTRRDLYGHRQGGKRKRGSALGHHPSLQLLRFASQSCRRDQWLDRDHRCLSSHACPRAQANTCAVSHSHPNRRSADTLWSPGRTYSTICPVVSMVPTREARRARQFLQRMSSRRGARLRVSCTSVSAKPCSTSISTSVARWSWSESLSSVVQQFSVCRW